MRVGLVVSNRITPRWSRRSPAATLGWVVALVPAGLRGSAREPLGGQMTTIRLMADSELQRIAEIDRSERITQHYKSREGVLDLIDVDIRAPRWGEPGGHTVQHYVETWQALLQAGSVLLGAFDGDRLVGFAIYQPFLSEGWANFAVLHVTRTHRRRGIGCGLTNEVVQLARAEGAQRLYVSATPTRATVDFYMKQGFEPVTKPNERLFALEPDDIHMEMML